MDLSLLEIVNLCKILYENVALGMYCFVCLLSFKSGLMASGSGFRTQEDGYQSLADLGKARGCSTNNYVTHYSLINS